MITQTKMIRDNLIVEYIVFVCMLVSVSCARDIREGREIECFKEVETVLLDQTSEKLNLDSIVSCFEWDSAMFAPPGYYEKYIDFNYEIIDRGLHGNSRNLNFIDEDSHWFYIYFLHKGNIKEVAIAISYSVVHPYCVTINNYLEKMPRRKMRFKIVSEANLAEHMCDNTIRSLVFDAE